LPSGHTTLIEVVANYYKNLIPGPSPEGEGWRSNKGTINSLIFALLIFIITLKSYGKGTNKGASFVIFTNAKELRKIQTEAEIKLWDEIRNRKLNGLKFRRQHPIGNYILDFYCHEKRLGIEIDGNIHLTEENIEYDKYRTYELKELGVTIIRFRNEEVIESLEKIKEVILKNILNN
jgi:very-short-patch-repair endonuclease